MRKVSYETEGAVIRLHVQHATDYTALPKYEEVQPYWGFLGGLVLVLMVILSLGGGH